MRAGTIVASNYSAMAQIVGESFLQHHPASTFTVLVVDDGPCTFTAGIQVARLGDLDLSTQSINVMKSIYDVMEFSTSVKASFLRLLLGASAAESSTGAGAANDQPIACYLDPDIVVYAPFDDCVAPALEHGVVLTPHALEPIPRDGRHVSEGTIMQSGMYNCGFVAVGRAGMAFLDWWDTRLRFDAVVDFEQSHFTDQRWVDWVPSLFDHWICRDPGMNLAWWNIHERLVEIGPSGDPLLGTLPVRFAHFSGFDPALPDKLSKFQSTAPRVENTLGTGMRTLSDDYADRLEALGHAERKRIPYQWNTSIDGVDLDRTVRRRVRTGILAEVGENGLAAPDRTTPDAFGGGTVSLADWLALDGREQTPNAPEPAPNEGVERADRRPGATVFRRIAGATDRVASVTATTSRIIRTKRRAHTSSSPFAFLHVPKSAGSSIGAALREALPDHRWGDFVFDPAWMGPYRHQPRPAALQHQVLESVDQLADVDAVAGHLLLETLRNRFDDADIATVVREPRCRLLSHYEYWRSLDDEARARELPWASSRSATTLDFADWLLDESIAYQSDNTLIRQLVTDDAIPENAFIPNDQVRRLARLAVARIRAVGWVGLVELGDATWTSLAAFVGAPLHPRRINVTPPDARLAVDLDALFGPATAALAARTAGDALVWDAAAKRVGVANPTVLADQAWMRRVGNIVRGERRP